MNFPRSLPRPRGSHGLYLKVGQEIGMNLHREHLQISSVESENHFFGKGLQLHAAPTIGLGYRFSSKRNWSLLFGVDYGLNLHKGLKSLELEERHFDIVSNHNHCGGYDDDYDPQTCKIEAYLREEFSFREGRWRHHVEASAALLFQLSPRRNLFFGLQFGAGLALSRGRASSIFHDTPDEYGDDVNSEVTTYEASGGVVRASFKAGPVFQLGNPGLSIYLHYQGLRQPYFRSHGFRTSNTQTGDHGIVLGVQFYIDWRGRR